MKKLLLSLMLVPLLTTGCAWLVHAYAGTNDLAPRVEQKEMRQVNDTNLFPNSIRR